MICVKNRIIFNMLYDAICVFVVLLIANLLALNCSFYEQYLMIGGWCNNFIKLLLGVFLVGGIIFLLFCFWRRRKIFMTLRCKYSYLTFSILQGCLFYPKSLSLLLEYNLNANDGLTAILAMLGNAIILFIFSFALVIIKQRDVFPLKLFSVFSKTFIVILIAISIALCADAWAGNYVGLINETVFLYCFISLKSK